MIDLAGVDESWFSGGAWGKRMAADLSMAPHRGRTTYHYDSHIPQPMRKDQMSSA